MFDSSYPLIPWPRGAARLRCGVCGAKATLGWVADARWREYTASGQSTLRPLANLKGLWNVVVYRLLRPDFFWRLWWH